MQLQKFGFLLSLVTSCCFGTYVDQDFEIPKFNHDVHGPKTDILNNDTVARRYEGGCWAVGVTDRPLKVNENVTFEITEMEAGWLGNLNVGVLYTDPVYLPPGSLVICDPNITDALNNTEVFIFKEFYNNNLTYTFRVDAKGDAYMTLSDVTPEVVFTGVHVDKPFWMIFNIYGQTKAVQLISKEND